MANKHFLTRVELRQWYLDTLSERTRSDPKLSKNHRATTKNIISRLTQWAIDFELDEEGIPLVTRESLDSALEELNRSNAPIAESSELVTWYLKEKNNLTSFETENLEGFMKELSSLIRRSYGRPAFLAGIALKVANLCEIDRDFSRRLHLAIPKANTRSLQPELENIAEVIDVWYQSAWVEAAKHGRSRPQWKSIYYSAAEHFSLSYDRIKKIHAQHSLLKQIPEIIDRRFEAAIKVANLEGKSEPTLEMLYSQVSEEYLLSSEFIQDFHQLHGRHKLT